MPLNWAVGISTGLGDHHAQGGLVLNLASGSTATATDDIHTRIFNHGLIMSVAWAFLLPLGAVVARHKWVLGHHHFQGQKHTWFLLHMGLQLGGVALMLAGFSIAVMKFGDQQSQLGQAHRLLGIIVTAMALLQVRCLCQA